MFHKSIVDWLTRAPPYDQRWHRHDFAVESPRVELLRRHELLFKPKPVLKLNGSVVVCEPASFGPTKSFTGKAVRVRPELADADLENAEALVGAVAVVRRGECLFVEKARRAMDAGAIGVVIINNGRLFEAPYAKDGDGKDINIPVVGVAQSTEISDGDEVEFTTPTDEDWARAMAAIRALPTYWIDHIRSHLQHPEIENGGWSEEWRARVEMEAYYGFTNLDVPTVDLSLIHI